MGGYLRDFFGFDPEIVLEQLPLYCDWSGAGWFAFILFLFRVYSTDI